MMKEKLFSVPAVWVGWVAARLISGYLMVVESNPRGDVTYYLFGVYGDDPTALQEYPHAGIWPSTLLALLIGDKLGAYHIAFAVMILCFDALFLSLLLRKGSIDSRYAAWFWVIFGTAVGQVFIMRLDLFPALLVAAAGYFLYKNPAVSGFFLAFATAMKLWPGLLAAGLVGHFRRARTWLTIAAFAASLIGFALITIISGGLDRLVSPLQYQGDRGLQIESVAATPFVFANYFAPGTWQLGYAPSKSFEITGPGVDVAISASNILMLFTVLAAVAWAVWQLFSNRWSPESALAFFIAAIIMLLLSNKVFSTQYITWLGPIIAVAIATPRADRTLRNIYVTMGAAACICGVLGTIVYPFMYEEVWENPGTAFLPIAALALRNIIIVAFAFLSCAALIRSCKQSPNPTPAP